MSCDSSINACPPCTDDPVLNIASEGPDSDRFVFNIDLLGGGPQLNELFEQLGCFAWCWSEISQEDADLCAIMQAIQCANDAIRQPATGVGGFSIIGGQVPPLLFNTAQFCQFTCPDGAAFGWTFPPNQVAARTLLEANRIAFSYACRYARLRKICITSTPDPACAGQAYTGRLEASGGTPFTTSQGQCPYLWQIISGSLPAGLSLNQCTGAITGTPTAGSSSTFTVRATDSIGSYQQKVVTLNVIEFTTFSALPDASFGVPYSETLAVVPSGTYFFQFFSGSPPDWLSLNSSTGELTGTPDQLGDFIFTISVETTGGTRCTNEFTLSVVPPVPDPIEYWTMDESSGNRVGEIAGVLLIPQFGVPVLGVTGKVADAAEFINSAFPYTSLSTDFPFERTELANLGTGFTVCGWAQLTDAFQLPFEIGFYDSLLNQMGVAHISMNGGANHIQASGVDAASNAWTLTQTDTAPTPGDWFFFRFWFDAASTTVKLQINNGLIEESAPGLDYSAQPRGSISIFPDSSFNPGLIMLVDELGIWMPPLTDDEADFVYNSGLGRHCCPFS